MSSQWVTFVESARVQQGDGKGEAYEAGTAYLLRPDQVERWDRRRKVRPSTNDEIEAARASLVAQDEPMSSPTPAAPIETFPAPSATVAAPVEQSSPEPETATPEGETQQVSADVTAPEAVSAETPPVTKPAPLNKATSRTQAKRS